MNDVLLRHGSLCVLGDKVLHRTRVTQACAHMRTQTRAKANPHGCTYFWAANKLQKLFDTRTCWAHAGWGTSFGLASS